VALGPLRSGDRVLFCQALSLFPHARADRHLGLEHFSPALKPVIMRAAEPARLGRAQAAGDGAGAPVAHLFGAVAGVGILSINLETSSSLDPG
jgi:hypothetical protein